jgi:hypothetical protein
MPKMRSQGGRTVKINPVDDVHELPDRGRVEALFDQNLFRMQIQRERSAAFWFAGSLFGVSGLVIGACLGAYMMFVAYTGLSAPVRDNIIAGAAIDDARNTVNNRDSLVDREMNQGSDQR